MGLCPERRECSSLRMKNQIIDRIMSNAKTETTKIFVNLPVKDLPKAKDFFGKLGFKFNSQFTDTTAACMVVSEKGYVMLLTHGKFKAFVPQAIADANQSTEVLVALS